MFPSPVWTRPSVTLEMGTVRSKAHSRSPFVGKLVFSWQPRRLETTPRLSRGLSPQDL